jgi:beta-lactamase class A
MRIKLVSRRLTRNNIAKLTRKSSRSERAPSQTSDAKNNSSPANASPPPTNVIPIKNALAPVQRSRPKANPPHPLFALLLYLVRLSILSIGLGAIAGTILTVVEPTQSASVNSRPQKIHPVKLFSFFSPQKAFSLNQELAPLEAKLETLAKKYPQLQPGAFFVDLDNNDYVEVRGETVYSAASTIKIPILIAFFQDVDAEKIHLDESLTLTKELIGGGSGNLQYQKPGSKISALETVTKMSVISDNTATNMIVERLGGKESLNKRFREWGLNSTVINNALPDLEGTNTTSPKDLVKLLAMLDRSELVSLKSRDRIFSIMRQTTNQTLLSQGIEKNATIAHKTGDIGLMLGDAGIIDMPNGKRYIGSVLVKRPHNDYSARTLVQEISRTTYQHFKWYLPRPDTAKSVANSQ